MAETLPINFPLETENVIASFSFTDIIDGTGVVVMRAFTSKDNTTADYHLGTNDLYSNDIITTEAVATTHAGFEAVHDIDFDLGTFNSSRIMSGTARVNITLGGNSTSTTGDKQIYAVITLRKWDGSSETDIVNKQTETLQHNVSTGVESKTMLVNIPITTDVSFAAGDLLRLNVVTWIKKTVGNGNLGFAHDPKDRNDDGSNIAQIIEDIDTTTLKAHIPFRIEQ